MSRLFVKTRALVAAAAFFAVSAQATPAAHAATGQENFTAICGACHTVGGGRRVGPDLKGVAERRPQEWLLKFIKSSQGMVQSGDPTAVALFNEFKITMPDVALSPAEIQDVLAYIANGAGAGAAPAAEVIPVRPASPADISRGQALFQGMTSFTNGGPACNSCHHVTNDAVIGGGVLAKDLTEVFGRMGGTGIHAVLGKPPFPVMEEAFKDAPLTDAESFALVAFLQDADRHHALQQPRDYGFKLLYSGVGVFMILMGGYAFLWRRRKVRAVNQAVFERQLRTQ
jgi:cytochrome c2